MNLDELYSLIKDCNEFDKVILCNCPEDVHEWNVSHTDAVWEDGVAVNKMFDRDPKQLLHIQKGSKIVLAYNEKYKALYICPEFPHWYFLSGLLKSSSYRGQIFDRLCEMF